MFRKNVSGTVERGRHSHLARQNDFDSYCAHVSAHYELMYSILGCTKANVNFGKVNPKINYDFTKETH
jgi:hypothetical protein